MKNKLVILFLLLQCGGFCAFAQVKIVALGSSTTMGAAATSNDSAWTGRLQTLFRKNTGPLNPDTVVYQVGDYGYTTYHVMPDGYVSPIPGRPAPVPGKNITTALSYHPDVVIINLPSNDVATLSAAWVTPLYNKKETMDNFRMLYQMVVADLEKPLAPGWERDVDDDLLRIDIAACVDGEAQSHHRSS